MHDLPWTTLETVRHEIGSNAPDAADDECPARSVGVGSFSICVLTVADFALFVDATGYETTAEEHSSGFSAATGEVLSGASWRDGSTPDDPVTQLSWFDARAYCHWSSHRLPTEAEWETAARLGAVQTSLQVWCEDWYSPHFHRDEQRVNPTGPNSGTERVVRGTGDRVSQRFHYLPDHSHDNLGVALVRGREAELQARAASTIE